MYGMAVADVDENLKIKSVEFHFDPNQILMTLEGRKTEKNVGPKCVQTDKDNCVKF